MKTIIIDGQVWQTGAWFRGMGVYVRSLFTAYIAQHPDTDLHIVVNQNMHNDDDRVAAIKGAFPRATVHELILPFQPKPGIGEEEKAKAVLNECVAAINAKEVFYFQPALFLFDYCAVFPDNVVKMVLFHDLIPLIFRDIAPVYAQYFPAHLYFPRFKTLFEADIIFANSQTTARDVEIYTGLPVKQFVNLDGSLNESLLLPPQESEKQVLKSFGVQRTPYVLLPTGGTPHKNNLKAVQAFSLFKQNLLHPIKLVTTSHFRDYEKAELRAIAGDDIIFTDVISDDQLGILFKNAQSVMFPSLYEGLGIPVLEAVAHDKPVACSDIDVFREIPHFYKAFYTFDPNDPIAMADALLQATAAVDVEAKKQHYPAILEKYSWARSAQVFEEALNHPSKVLPKATKRIAITCPDPRKNNSVAKLAQRMYGYGLQRGIEFVYFIDSGGDDEVGVTVFADYIRGIALCYDIADFEKQLAQTKFASILHFASDDVRFPKLMRAILAHPGFVYIGNDDFLPVINKARDMGIISETQAEAEAVYSVPKGVRGASFLVNAKGIVAENHVAKKVQESCAYYGSKAQVLAVPEAAVTLQEQHAQTLQNQVFNQIIDVIGG